MPTKAEIDNEIAQHQSSIKVLTERLKELGVGEETAPATLAAKHREQDEAETLFERSTPAERLQLYHDDHDAWQRMMDAHEAAGLRRLFGGRR
jgi:hypothetical protein